MENVAIAATSATVAFTIAFANPDAAFAAFGKESETAAP